MPATFLINTTADSGAGSLRQAILDSNANAGADTIDFSIGSGAQTIALLSGLPAITESVAIDATTQPRYAGTPLIELPGDSAGSGASGFTITAAGSTIQGFVINRFSTAGILIRGASATGNTVAGNYIGTDASGTAALANVVGIQIDTGAGSNTIG